MVMTAIAACDDYETYGDKKKKERDAMATFLSDSAFQVISEETFNAQGNTTDVSKKEFVYLTKSGVYMQIVRKGCGTILEENRQVNLLCRFYEYSLLDKVYSASNITDPRNYDKMTITRTGSNYTASFTTGVMYSTYGAFVPSGWMVPLQYLLLGRQDSEESEIARVRLIVPHSQGHSTASSYVYPFFYDITYQRAN